MFCHLQNNQNHTLMICFILSYEICQLCIEKGKRKKMNRENDESAVLIFYISRPHDVDRTLI